LAIGWRRAEPLAQKTFMSSYAIAHVRWARLSPAIVEYLRRIDSTRAPFDGKFLMLAASPGA
jgi:hypothetical protein